MARSFIFTNSKRILSDRMVFTIIQMLFKIFQIPAQKFYFIMFKNIDINHLLICFSFQIFYFFNHYLTLLFIF